MTTISTEVILRGRREEEGVRCVIVFEGGRREKMDRIGERIKK